MNRGLIARGEAGAVQVMTWMGQHKRVRKALKAAGIANRARVTWLSCGARLVREANRGGFHGTGTD
jgi:hypothetical protein